MARHKREPYMCPRCGYSVSIKSSMYKHLYCLKNECPGSTREIELTEEIKQSILKNRLYHVQDPVKLQNQTVNNYNIINNIVANMDVFEKWKQLTTYKQINVLDFESKVEDTYMRNVKRLENDKFKHGFKLKDNDFLDIINTLTRVIQGENKDSFLEFLNFMYDNKKKRIKVYSSEKWEEYLVDKGLAYLIDTIAGNYLETYECYLIRKIIGLEGVCPQDSCGYLACLEEYYKFIASFDVEPFVKGKYDNQVMFNREDDEYDEAPRRGDIDGFVIVERFMKVFKRMDDGLTNAEKRSMHKKVLDVIKTNAQENVCELDKSVIGLIKMDSEFKQQTGLFISC